MFKNFQFSSSASPSRSFDTSDLGIPKENHRNACNNFIQNEGVQKNANFYKKHVTFKLIIYSTNYIHSFSIVQICSRDIECAKFDGTLRIVNWVNTNYKQFQQWQRNIFTRFAGWSWFQHSEQTVFDTVTPISASILLVCITVIDLVATVNRTQILLSYCYGLIIIGLGFRDCP